MQATRPVTACWKDVIESACCCECMVSLHRGAYREETRGPNIRPRDRKDKSNLSGRRMCAFPLLVEILVTLHLSLASLTSAHPQGRNQVKSQVLCDFHRSIGSPGLVRILVLSE